ncbi:MFS transporter [Novosphingobium lindaniclasticum]|uniref:MFS transporter n=1 Tax=Novosphingobium lindaniclasticum LE124 TaxID=1096930 RepID=T0IR77_9SPHN|nr:MFS transporter [Novosphingobium lindaniclasticum]EQB14320.1 hypothetical protein L284_13065 [Novosphingobium lindaniclasticum LE124]
MQRQLDGKGWRRAVEPLRIKVFRRFWLAGIVANLGSMMQSVSAAWLMTSLTPGAQTVALVQTATSIPMMLFALVAGTLADIVDRRTIMILGQATMAIVTLSLAALTLAGWITPAGLLITTFLIACGNALYAPAWQASVVEQVSRPQLEAATSLNSIGFNVARSIGPAIGGALVAATGSGVVFVLNGLANLSLIGVISTWRRPKPVVQLPPETIAEGAIAGIRYAWLSPHCFALMVRAAAFGFCGSCVWALTPVLARSVFGGGPVTLGLLLGGFGAGAIIGAIIRAHLPITRANLLRYSTMLTAVATVALPLLPLLIPAIVLMALIGGAWVATLTGLSVSVQMIVPRWVVGRIIALNQMAVFAGLGSGSLMWGTVAQFTDIRSTFIAAALTMAASLLLDRWFPVASDLEPDIRSVRDMPQDPISPPLDDGTGLIVISLTYEVPSANAQAFVAAMQDLGRIRSRDGARRWSIQQDLDDPRLWEERFSSPNWLEHLRRQVRPVHEDQSVRERVAALHIGRPVIRRMIERGRVSLTRPWDAPSGSVPPI